MVAPAKTHANLRKALNFILIQACAKENMENPVGIDTLPENHDDFATLEKKCKSFVWV